MKMAVVSKFLDTAIDRYEKLGVNRNKLSAGLAGLVAATYVAHLAYPHLTRLITGSHQLKDRPCSSNTSSSTSDDEEFDSDTDEYDTNPSSDLNINEDQTKRNNNNTRTTVNNRKNVEQLQPTDNDEMLRGNIDANQQARLMSMSTKRKKKQSTKVIKQQIKQAEKLLAAANKERAGQHDVVDFHTAKNRIGLNWAFVLQFKRLIEIMIPKLWCRETTILGVHTMCLLSRTFLSFYVASVEGSIVKYIVRKDFRQFIIGLMKWFGIAIPATFINSMIRYLENKLALSFR